jgi:hypothetical protein
MYRVTDGTLAEYELTRSFGKEWISKDYAEVERIPNKAIPGLPSYLGWMYTPYKTESTSSRKTMSTTGMGFIEINGATVHSNVVKTIREVMTISMPLYDTIWGNILTNSVGSFQIAIKNPIQLY